MMKDIVSNEDMKKERVNEKSQCKVKKSQSEKEKRLDE